MYNQSVCQSLSVSLSVCQSVSQSVSQAINHSLIQSINQSILFTGPIHNMFRTSFSRIELVYRLKRETQKGPGSRYLGSPTYTILLGGCWRLGINFRSIGYMRLDNTCN